MPLHLDDIDIKIIESLVQDGRKSFRQISRETKITTPTVKARFERLVNVGFIKGVIPVFDFNQIENDKEDSLAQMQGIKNNANQKEERNTNEDIFKAEIEKIKRNITSDIAIKVVCDFCEGPISGNPKVLKFADIERFFCCMSCKSGYSEKYKGRIESIKRKYKGKDEF
jgi:Lrp/AsnC family leucine-responsive transcriptional regulator